MLQMTLIIRGKVQQVGYRYSVLEFIRSERLPVRGHVSNRPDGSVQLVAQGDIESLKSIHRFATKGPPRAQVREVEEDIQEIGEFTYIDFTMD